MRKVIALVSAALIAVLAVVWILNRTPKTYRVTGTISRDGKLLEWNGEKVPLPAFRARTVGLLAAPHGQGPFLAASALFPDRRIVLQIIFAPVNRTPDSPLFRCEGEPLEGTYILPNIPSGKYRVSIQQLDPFPTNDLLQVKYSLKDSPIIREVSGDGEINIDLTKELP